MAVIKIPSKNIYSVSGDSILLKNKIANAQINSNRFVEQNGDVTEENLTTTFWSQKSTEDATLAYVGTNTDINKFQFPRVSLVAGEGRAGATITLDLKQLSNIITEETSSGELKITSHKLKSVKKWTSSLSYNNSQEIIGVYEPTIKSIDGRKITLYYELSMQTRVGDIDFYLLEDTISIVGKYYESNQEIASLTTQPSEHIFSLPTNELENLSNTYDGLNFTSSKLSKVVNKYKNGKEVITLKCSASNYYDVDGNLVICPTVRGYPMTFSKYDIVEPYVFTVNGEVPLSSKLNGETKQFEVIGIDFSYSGVFWQELTLQEYSE